MVQRRELRVWRNYATRWTDNDAYGHVNNSIYYHWFDSAVNAWLVAEGLLDIARGDPIAVVAETRCRYSRSLSFPQLVEVGIAVAELGRSSIRYRIGVFGEGDDAAAADGEFVHVVVDRTSRRPAPIPDSWRIRLESIR